MSGFHNSARYNRRRFLQTSSAAGAGLLGAQLVMGQDATVARGANDRLSIGLVGVGSRGGYHLRTLGALADKAKQHL